MPSVLVTGAAGYIGSVVAERLIRDKMKVIALDDLSQGHEAAIHPDALFVRGSVNDGQLLDAVFAEYGIDVVVHMAGATLVSESMMKPGKYFHKNLSCGLTLLDAMIRNLVSRIVFSSSCAVYGQPETVPVSEQARQQPISVYGETKAMFEKCLFWYGHAHGLASVSLRYFNAAGATSLFGEDHRPESHLIPNLMKVALGQAEKSLVFGRDYPTRDGSCVRDYVHVLDIADAHIRSLALLKDSGGCSAFNLGSGRGQTVLEVADAVRKASGSDVPVEFMPRREGDPAVLLADSSRASSVLGWQPVKSDIATIVGSAWKWHRQHPRGY